MSTFRYSRWDGSQQLPSFDADDVLDALSEDILAEGDVRRALQQLMQRGLRGTRGGDIPGLRRIRRRLRARRQEELSQSNLDGVLDDVKRLEGILDTERAGIERRVHEAEQRALDAPPGEEQDQSRMAEQVMRRTARQRSANCQVASTLYRSVLIYSPSCRTILGQQGDGCSGSEAEEYPHPSPR